MEVVPNYAFIHHQQQPPLDNGHDTFIHHHQPPLGDIIMARSKVTLHPEYNNTVYPPSPPVFSLPLILPGGLSQFRT